MAALNPYPSTTTPAWSNQPIEFSLDMGTLDWQTYERVMGWQVPLTFSIVSWSVQLPRIDFDRMHLARIASATLAPPPVLRALVADRCPRLVRRAPRPAGRPYGWRRRRKGGRRV